MVGKFRTARITVAVMVVAFSLLALGAPRASADTINLAANNLGLQASVGTISLTETIANQVHVDILMAPGFSLKVKDGNDVNFNTSAQLAASNLSNFTGKIFSTTGTTTYPGMTVNFNNPGANADGYGAFGISLFHLDFPQPNNIASISEFSFDVTQTGLTPANLEVANSQNAEWAVHFCDGPASGCAVWTGFAANAGAVRAIPEPGTLALLGAGLIGLAGFLRRRQRSKE